MRPRLISILLLSITLSNCVTVNKYPTTIASKTKIELPSFIITCKFNDIAIITAPQVREIKARYYLYKPNGEVIKLDDFNSRSEVRKNYATNDTINDNVINDDGIKTTKYRVFNVNRNQTQNSTKDIFEDNVKDMGAMEFMIGPLAEEDHGNWVLSIFTDLNGESTEFFQVISVAIVEKIPADPPYSKLSAGSRLNLRFAYPINDLEMCELLAPRSSGDRSYDRSRSELNTCAYVVPIVTAHDEGWWTIVGVGKIVYEAAMYLKVN